MTELTSEHAGALLKFLSNTQIIGQDAPLFMQCVFALQQIANPNQELNGATSGNVSPEPRRSKVNASADHSANA